MRVQLEECRVLHTRPYRDSSLIVELFSRQRGRVAAVARGARGSRSRGGSRASLLQLFRPLLCSWSGRSDLKTLAAVEPAPDAAQAAALTGERMYSGLYVNELLVRLLHHEDPHPRLYDYYTEVLARLGEGAPQDLSLRAFEFRLLEELGYGFDLATDGLSGEPVRAGDWYSFDREHGLVTAGLEVREEIPRYSGTELLQISRGDFDEDARRCAKRLMREALACHLGGKPLKSRELFPRR